MSSPANAASQRAAPKFKITSLIWSVYAPSFLLSLGQGILIPVLPLFAGADEGGLGGTALIVGLAVSGRHIGTMIFDVPAGICVSRFGLKKTMVVGVGLFALAAVGAGLAPGLWVLIAMRLLAGVSFALWSISRHAYIAQAVPIQSRGRALSLFGGISRIATILGPLLGGLVGEYAGLRAPFFAQALVGGLTLLLVLLTMRRLIDVARPSDGHNIYAVLGQTVSSHRREFSTAGLAAICLQFMRAGRELLLPLWGAQAGLGSAEIGYIVTVSSTIDSTMFVPVGYVMDRFGRKWSGAPSLIVLGTSMAMLPLLGGFWGLMVGGMLVGLGNGMSSGWVLTMGTDLSPRERSGEFLGVWRLISDTGGATGPFAIGAIAQVLTLGAASVVTGGIGWAGAAVVIFMVKETLVKQRPTPR